MLGFELSLFASQAGGRKESGSARAADGNPLMRGSDNQMRTETSRN